MIIKNIPYIEDKEEKFASCQGPPSVLMVFRYFLPDINMFFPRLYKELNYTHATWFFETYIARLFHKFKIPAVYYSTYPVVKIGQSAENFNDLTGEDFSNPLAREEVDIENYDSSVDYVKSNNLFRLGEIKLELLKSLIDEGKLIIATVNRNKLVNKPGFKGHFIVVKGYDDNNFICNDAYLGENIKIEFEKFRESFYLTVKNKNNPRAEMVVIG